MADIKTENYPNKDLIPISFLLTCNYRMSTQYIYLLNMLHLDLQSQFKYMNYFIYTYIYTSEIEVLIQSFSLKEMFY